MFCRVIPLAHPIPYVSTELLWNTEKHSFERFCRYLRGKDVCLPWRKGKVTEQKITKALEIYQLLKSVVIQWQFLDPVAIGRIWLYNDENFTYERSAYEAARPLVKLIFIEIYRTAECFWGLSHNRSSLLKRTKRRRYFQFDHWGLHAQNSGKASAPPRRQLEMKKLNVTFVRMSNPVPREELSKLLKRNKKKRAKDKFLLKTWGDEKQSVQRSSRLERSSWSFHRRWH